MTTLSQPLQCLISWLFPLYTSCAFPCRLLKAIPWASFHASNKWHVVTRLSYGCREHVYRLCTSFVRSTVGENL